MDLRSLLGEEAESLLTHEAKAIPAQDLVLPGPDFIDRVLVATDRPPAVLRNLGSLFGHGRLAGTGYLSILPVDQGIEHSGAASFAKNPAYFDPKNLCELAIEGGCNAIATTFGVLGMVSRRYAHKIPYIVKLNHNELLTYPNKFDQVMFGSVQEAYELGAVGVGATIYFGSEESTRQLQEVSEAFQEAHALGLFTVLWCYLRNNAFKKDGVDYSVSADLTGQANHMGVTIEADIIKQKMPENNGGYNALGFGKTDKLVYNELTTDHPIDLTRWQVVNCYMGRVPLINSGGESKGDSRPRAGRADRGDQQAGRGHRADRRPQVVPAPDAGRRGAAQRRAGRLPRQERHRRLTRPASTSTSRSQDRHPTSATRAAARLRTDAARAAWPAGAPCSTTTSVRLCRPPGPWKNLRRIRPSTTSSAPAARRVTQSGAPNHDRPTDSARVAPSPGGTVSSRTVRWSPDGRVRAAGSRLKRPRNSTTLVMACSSGRPPAVGRRHRSSRGKRGHDGSVRV